MNAMTTITFDTLDIAERLEKAGATPEYAKAEAVILRDVLSSALETNFATHDDAVKIDRWLDSLENKIEAIEQKFDAKFDKVYWMIGIIGVLNLANFAKNLF